MDSKVNPQDCVQKCSTFWSRLLSVEILCDAVGSLAASMQETPLVVVQILISRTSHQNRRVEGDGEGDIKQKEEVGRMCIDKITLDCE